MWSCGWAQFISLGLDFIQFADSACVALRHIRQAVDFLVFSLKPIRTWEEIRNDAREQASLQNYFILYYLPVGREVLLALTKNLVSFSLTTYFIIISLFVQALSLQQLERIVGMYWDDLNGTNVTSTEFISSMRATMHEESNSVSSFSVLLDDDSRF
ncbi:myosin-17-like isoform X3 [Phragmites australis]|uniref:myosin-17-like isoform X3 n=1 Tax=Phragmites australis TaxID=29695 RepID=UPI002D78A152|nr:myosin-17-like isoform X3 [Phragmites australis]